MSSLTLRGSGVGLSREAVQKLLESHLLLVVGDGGFVEDSVSERRICVLGNFLDLTCYLPHFGAIVPPHKVAVKVFRRVSWLLKIRRRSLVLLKLRSALSLLVTSPPSALPLRASRLKCSSVILGVAARPAPVLELKVL